MIKGLTGRVLVCGSRTVGYQTTLRILDRLCPDASEIIQGDARGVDRSAGRWAIGRGILLTSVPAEWEKHGRSAGPIRNQRMLDMRPDWVLAIWDGKSAGTAHMIEQAKLKNIPVKVVKVVLAACGPR